MKQKIRKRKKNKKIKKSKVESPHCDSASFSFKENIIMQMSTKRMFVLLY